MFSLKYDIAEHFGWDRAEQVCGITFGEEQEVKMYDFVFDDGNSDGNVKFGMVVLARNGDSINAVSCVYSLKFALGHDIMKRTTTRKILGFSFSSTDTYTERRRLGFATQSSLRNFCALKALEEFQRRGIVSKINMLN